jgi:hypothetical protein
MAVTRQTLNIVGMCDLDTWHELRSVILRGTFTPDNIHMAEQIKEASRDDFSKTRKRTLKRRTEFVCRGQMYTLYTVT